MDMTGPPHKIWGLEELTDYPASGKWVDQTAWVQHHGIIELDRNPATDFILSAHGLWSGGDARLVARNATPGGTVAFAYSLTPAPGQTTVPIGPCGSVLVDLPSPIHALGVVQADSDGVAVLDAGTIPILKRQPNIRIQAIDLGSCQLSNCMGGWIR